MPNGRSHMKKDHYILIYITVPNRRAAQQIGAALLQARLVACINILGPVTARYWWQGRVAQAREWLVLAKSRAALAKPIIRRVQALHAYEVPCIVTLPLGEGNPDFLRWIGQETRARKPRR